MRFVFFGSGDFAAGLLRALVGDGLAPALVVSTPDKPKGRGRKPRPGPVAEAARALGLELSQPPRVNSEEFVSRLPAPDFLLVSDFGRILKKDLLAVPRIAPLNLHPSPLPLWRGAAPVERSIMAGGPYGITLFVMDEGLDTGPVVLQEELEPGPWPTKGDLIQEYLRRAPDLIKKGMEGLMAGRISPVAQPPEGSYAPKIDKAEFWPEWRRSPDRVARHINALSPTPGARIVFRDRLLKLLRAEPGPRLPGRPGEVVVDSQGLFVVCGEASVAILRVQPEAKRPMTAQEFIRGLR